MLFWTNELVKGVSYFLCVLDGELINLTLSKNIKETKENILADSLN